MILEYKNEKYVSLIISNNTMYNSKVKHTSSEMYIKKTISMFIFRFKQIQKKKVVKTKRNGRTQLGQPFE